MIRPNLMAHQMDYVFFFYGASFIFLGAVCFAVLRRGAHTRQFPWWWLGLFGFIHGLNEWLDMAAVSLGDSHAFRTARLAVMVVSFVCLMEFARRATPLVFKKNIGKSFYLFLLIAGSLGAWQGWPGVNASARYCFGLVSALWSAVILLSYRGTKESPLSSSTAAFIKIAGASMCLYALATGLIVPYARFFPASSLNLDTFIAFFHLPVQFFRALFAFAIAMGIALYSIRQSIEVFVKEEPVTERRFWVVSMAVALFVLVLFYAGWRLVEHQGQRVEQIERGTRQLRAKVYAQLVTTTIAQLHGVNALAGSPVTIDYLKGPDPAGLELVNERLDRFREALLADVCYVMDKTGLTLAASNRGSPRSFVGKSYAFRPYFQKAVSGEHAVYLAKGVTSLERGIYVSVPVIDKASREAEKSILGVAVAKATMDELGVFFRDYPYVFLVSPEGIIFVASRAEWIFRGVGDMPLARKEALRESKQFGEGPWDNVGFEEMDDEKGMVFFRGKTLYFVKEPIPELAGWHIYFMDEQSNVPSTRFMMIMIFMSFFLLIAVIALFIFRISLDTLYISASETLYEALVEGAPDCIELFDKHGRCVSINKNGMAMMGLGKEDAVGKLLCELWGEASKEKFRQGMLKVLQGKKQGFEAAYFHPDGKAIAVSVTLAPISEADSEIKYFICIARDITEEKQARERLMQSSKMATVGALATGVSHEFNNVLEIILGNAEMAFTSKDPEMIRKSLSAVIDSARRAAWITKTVMGFSGQASESRELVDLAELLKQNIVFLEKVFESNAIVIETRFSETPRLYCNPAQLSQAFINIMINARDAMRGSTEKKLSVTLDYDIDSSEVRIVFQDTGKGVKEEVRDKLFGAFVTTKGLLGGGEDRQPGVGLGLFVAYGIVKQHNGNIAVESQEGRGARFIISLPIFTEEGALPEPEDT